MLRLVTTSDKIQAVLGGAVTTSELQVVACYSDKTASAYTGGANRVNTNGTTDVDVVGAPGSSTVRDVDLINVYQRDTANATVTLKIDVSGTEHILGKWTLAAGDVLTYTHGHAWQVIDSTGQLKGSGSGGGGAVDSVNGQTGTVVLDPDDLDDTSTTNKFVTASDITKLGNLSGTNSGDVSLAGTPDYITISGQTITRGQVDLTADVTGDLPLANLAQASAASKLLGRGSASGGGDYEEISLGSGLSMSGTTLSATGGGGGSVGTFPGGRLTTESGVGVSTSDRTSQSTLYYTPFVSDYIRLYNGSSVAEYAFTERSLALSGLTSGKNYDVFLYDNSGTLTLELTAWTSDTARATALAWQTGLGWVKSGAATRLYLGTVRTTSTTTTESSNANRFVWNAYNQSLHTFSSNLGGGNWTCSSTTTREIQGVSTYRRALVCGISISLLRLYWSVFAGGSGAGANYRMSWAEDGTSLGTVANGFNTGGTNTSATGQYSTPIASLHKYPAIGYHYYAPLERAAGGTCDIYADVSPDGGMGIWGHWQC